MEDKYICYHTHGKSGNDLYSYRNDWPLHRIAKDH